MGMESLLKSSIGNGLTRNGSTDNGSDDDKVCLCFVCSHVIVVIGITNTDCMADLT